MAIDNPMWRNIGTSADIGISVVFLAQHDGRKLFAPLYPAVDGPFTDAGILPGDHSTIVERKEGRPEAHELVFDGAQRFLHARGMQLADTTQLGEIEILRRYTLIAEPFGDDAQFAKGVSGKPGKPKDRFKEQRPIRNDRRDKSMPGPDGMDRESVEHAKRLPLYIVACRKA